MDHFSQEPSSTFSHAVGEDDQRAWWTDGAVSDTTPTQYQSSSVPVPTDFPLLVEDQPSSPAQLWLSLTVLGVAFYWIYLFCKSYYNNYVLKRDTLEKRRRLGIPDDDERPINIAYNAAAQRRLEELAAKREEEEREAQSREQQNTPWAQLGREFREPLATGNAVKMPLRDGLSFRPNGNRPMQTGFDTRTNTLSSATSLSFNGMAYHNQNTGVPAQLHAASTAAWQDRYAPVSALQSQHTANRAAHNKPRADRPATTLGRRSRKQLNLEVGPEAESDVRQPSRRRLNDWGLDHEIDGDEEARWAYEGEFFPAVPLKDSNRIRKRDDEDDGPDDVMPPVRSRRKIGGQDIQNATSAPRTGRIPKRKTRDDDVEQNETEDLPRVTKTKKRVRVVSYHDSQSGHSNDAEMEGLENDEDVSSDPLCQGRRIGERWSADGVNFMVGQDGRRLREILVKEKEQKYKMPADSKHRDRKAYIYSVIKKWVDEDQFVKAKADKIIYDEKKDGKLSPSKGNKLVIPEPSLTEESTPRSEPGSEWGSVKGQTPLKSGFLRTTSGHDRPPIPALFRNFGQHVDQARLAHIGSPGKKALVLGAALPKALKGASKWERQNREAQALAALRLSRSTSKPDVAAKESESKPSNAFALGAPSGSTAPLKPSSSMPAFLATGTKPTSLNTTASTTPPKASQAPDAVVGPPVITVTAASASETAPPAIPSFKSFVTEPAKPTSAPLASTAASSAGAPGFFAAPSLPKPLFATPNPVNAPNAQQSSISSDKPVPAFSMTTPSDPVTAPPTKPEPSHGQPFAFGLGQSSAPAPSLGGTSQPVFSAVPSFEKPPLPFFSVKHPAKSGERFVKPSTTATNTPFTGFGAGANGFGTVAKPAETKTDAQPSLFGANNTPGSSSAIQVSFGGSNLFSAPKEEGTSKQTTAPVNTNSNPNPSPPFPFSSGPASKPLNIFGAAASSPAVTTFDGSKKDAPQAPGTENSSKPFGFGSTSSFGAAPGFGNTTSVFTATTSNPTAEKDGKSTFSFGATSAAPSGLGGASKPAAPPAFGGFGSDANKAPSVFGGSGFSGFGNTTFGKPANDQKPEDKPSNGNTGFKFGTSGPSSTTVPEPANKPLTLAATSPFGFGAGATGGFQFGATSGPTQPNGNSSAPAFGNGAPGGGFVFGAAAHNDISRAQTPGEGTPSPAEAVFKLGRGNAESPGPGSRPRKPLPRKH